MSIEELKKYKDFDIIPVMDLIYSDFTTPLNVLRNIMKKSNKFYLLESVIQGRSGRYSYLGFDPIHSISCKDYLVNLDGNIYKSLKPFDEIKKLLEKYRAPKIEGFPPFCGGIVGYASYDSYQYFEPKMKFNSKDIAKFNDYEFLMFDKVICFDSVTQKIYIIVNIKTDDLENNYKNGLKDIEKIKNLINENVDLKVLKNEIIKKPESIDSIEEYSKKIDIIKKHIYDGDIFQCVFSRRFEGKMKGSLFNAYRALRTINPSPYMYYLKNEEIEIAGCSPETLVSKENDTITTFPIAGTRPRGKTLVLDNELERDLLNDEKELAEHNMLVDLGRNDIGRVAKFNTVNVVEYKKVLRFSHVMHLASTVVGKINDNYTSLDVLNSILPAGTLSGAPKKRAMEIIDSLEKTRRGIYGGGLGYIDFRDNMNMCIVIRTIIKKNDDIYLQDGGGIVMDSNTENEFMETENKAMATFKAIEEII